MRAVYAGMVRIPRNLRGVHCSIEGYDLEYLVAEFVVANRLPGETEGHRRDSRQYR